MIEKTIATTVGSCTQDTAPPVTLRYVGTDNAEVLWVVMRQPKWLQWVNMVDAVRGPNAGSPEAMAKLVVLCVESWGLPRPCTEEAVLDLPLELFMDLVRQATEIVTVADAQLKNFRSPSQPAGTPTVAETTQG